MTSDFITSYAARRMEQLGFGKDFSLEMRTFNLPPGSRIRMGFWNVWMYIPMDLFPTGAGIRVDSNFGLLDPNGSHFMQQHEHTGWITLENTDTQPRSLTFLAALPNKL